MVKKVEHRDQPSLTIIRQLTKERVAAFRDVVVSHILSVENNVSGILSGGQPENATIDWAFLLMRESAELDYLEGVLKRVDQVMKERNLINEEKG